MTNASAVSRVLRQAGFYPASIRDQMPGGPFPYGVHIHGKGLVQVTCIYRDPAHAATETAQVAQVLTERGYTVKYHNDHSLNVTKEEGEK